MLLRSGPFRPSPAEQAEVIDQLLDPTLSLQEVAERNRISLEDLLLYMEEPEVSERLDRLSSLKAKHTLRQAQWSLDSCVTALRLMVEDYTSTACNTPTNPKDPAQAESKRRSARTAQRAIWLLWRLAAFDPTATSKPRPGPGPRPAPSDPSLQRELEDHSETRPSGSVPPTAPDHLPAPRFDHEFRRELEIPRATTQPSSAGRCSSDLGATGQASSPGRCSSPPSTESLPDEPLPSPNGAADHSQEWSEGVLDRAQPPVTAPIETHPRPPLNGAAAAKASRDNPLSSAIDPDHPLLILSTPISVPIPLPSG